VRALAPAALLAAGAASAQPGPGPVYAAFDRGEGGRGSVTFVISDPATPEAFAPVAAFRVAPTEQGCGTDFAADANIPEMFRAAPVLNPLDPAARVVPAALPPAMADLAVSQLQALDLVSAPEALRAHQVCVRRLWDRIVGLRR
jgi:hypothetical protein